MTWFAVGGLAVSAAGSIASSFMGGGGGGQLERTPQEIRAAKDSKKVFKQSQDIQDKMNELSEKALGIQRTGLGNQTNWLKSVDSQGQYDKAAGMARSKVMDQVMPQLTAGVQTTASGSGGPGSGRTIGAMGEAAGGLDAAMLNADTQGRVNNLGDWLTRKAQFAANTGKFASANQALLNTYTSALNNGLNLEATGAQEAAVNQQNYNNWQTQNNMAAAQGVGSITGVLGKFVAGLG